jgi:hypothetical protein
VERFPECGKPIDLDVGAGLAFDGTNVPDDLAHLVPFVNKWSFDNLHDQDVFVTRMKRYRGAEIDELNAAFNHEIRGRIREWSASLPFDKHVGEFTADDWNHPYWSFLNVLKLLETTGGYGDSPAIEEAIKRHQEETRRERYAEATTRADNAFRIGNYLDYVEILTEYDDLLTETQRKKMGIARKKMLT